MQQKAIPDKLRGFDYQDVELKPSHWEAQRRDTIETYLAIDNDDLLHYFRSLAHLPAPGNGLTGWYGTGATTFGQKLGAFAKLYRVTGDYRLKEKAVYLADEWGKCAQASEKVLDVNDSYAYDKLMGGFLDLYEYLNYGKAVSYISLLTDSAIRRFPRDIKRDGLQDGGLWGRHMIEWYTLPENLYRAYELTGENKYFEFAREWDYDYFWDKLNRHDFQIGPRHAYSHVNSLSSAARAYEVTGDERYLNAMKTAYEEITAHHTFITGGYGPAECLFPDREGYLGDSLKDAWDSSVGDGNPLYTNFGGDLVGRNNNWGSCEVSCCAWAVFKFCNYLLRFTGEAKYGDWVEKMLYNGTGGQLPITGDGHVMYYASYFVDGAFKTQIDNRLQPSGSAHQWQCCTGTFPQDVAEYANLLYYHDADGLYVSQYLPSKCSWTSGGVPVSLENFSHYPEEPVIRLRISVETDTRFLLRLRVPSWANGQNRVAVNGETQTAQVKPNTWLELDRVWKDGDIITAEFPFSLALEPVDEKNREIAALRYGPIVLAADEMSVFRGDIGKPEQWIEPVQGEPFTFRTRKGHVAGYDFLTRTFRPYYKIPAMEWYYLYFRVLPEI